MFFSEVIGNDSLKDKLRESVRHNRVSHAQLFLGPEGCGNLPMALAFAQYLNCENRGEDSCGECASCRQASQLMHPDIHFTFPFIFNEKEKRLKCSDWMPEWRSFVLQNPYRDYTTWIRHIRKENKQGNINAKECADIIHRLSLKTYTDGYKVLVLWLPEFLEKEGNRLLKLIEEPPDKTIFLFVGHNPDRILNTILSRLQVTRFSRLTDEEIAQGLAASDGLTEESARNIAILANGNMSRALELVHVSASDYTNDLYKWLVVCATPRIPDMIDWADKFRALGREEQKAFLYYAIHVFREILLMLNHAASLNRLTGKEMELAGRLGKKLDAERVERILQVFDRYIYYVERNASAKILAMNLSVEIMHTFTRKSLPARQVFFKAADV